MRFKYFYIGLLLISQRINAIDPASVSVMALSAASSIDSLTEKKSSLFRNFLSPKGELNLEKISFTINEHMNNDSAVKVHLVIPYDKGLSDTLSELTAKEYFNRYKQLVKDYPDKIKILEWQFPAEKKKTGKIDVEYESSFLTPSKSYIFANYQNHGDHRLAIPKTATELEIRLDQNDFDKVTEDDKEKAKIDAIKKAALDSTKALGLKGDLKDAQEGFGDLAESEDLKNAQESFDESTDDLQNEQANFDESIDD